MSSKYGVVEIFPTLQGEGLLAGRACVFLRLSGCNQWNGRPEDRAKGSGACAMWCDTNFAKGDSQDLAEVLTRLEANWQQGGAGDLGRMVVISGGEPTLQLDLALAKALKHEGWFTSIETNGTNQCEALDIIDHVCVSPKRGSTLVVWRAEELKVVLPGGVPAAPPEHQWSDGELLGLADQGDWGHLFVQPQDVTDPTTVELTALTHGRSIKNHSLGSGVAGQIYSANVNLCVDFVRRNPRWRLSLQQHKYIGVR